MTEITLNVPDDMVHLIEEWVKHIPEMEIVDKCEAKEYGLDETERRVALAIQVMKEGGAIRHKYDYTWIMVAIGNGVIKGMLSFRSPAILKNR